jgi:organic radical activating enzyme
MTFIRFAGCNVGTPYTPEERRQNGLKIYQEKCTAWNGQQFPCDTNYKMAQKMSIEAIVATVGAPRVCLTGGEPMMHDLGPLVRALIEQGTKVHIETSGTKPLRELMKLDINSGPQMLWVCVSPKGGFLPENIDIADEVKVLVDDSFDENLFLTLFVDAIADDKVWIQPINDEYNLRNENVKRCLDLQKKYPNLKLSIQLHKILGVR